MECVVCVWLGTVLVVHEWLTGLGLCFTNSGGTWGKWDMCPCFGCSGVGGDLVSGLGRVWEGVVVLCLYYRCLWQVQVSVHCARWIPAHLMCTQCSFISASYLVCGRYRKSRLVCVLLTFDCLAASYWPPGHPRSDHHVSNPHRPDYY